MLTTRDKKEVRKHAHAFKNTILTIPEVEGAEILRILKGEWSEEENRRFIDALRKFGKNFDQITETIGTKTLKQVKGYARNLMKRVEVKRGKAPSLQSQWS